MRYGLIGSILIHIAVFGLVIFNFVGGRQEPPQLPPAVSIEIANPSDISEQKRGKAEAKDDKPAIVAEKKEPDAEAVAKKEVEPKVVVKPADKEALPPPTKTAEPQANTQKPQDPPKQEPPRVEKAEAQHEKAPEKPKPLPKKEAEHKPVVKPKTEEPKKADEAAKTLAQRKFDPNRIASLLNKDAETEPHAPPSQTMMNAQPSKTVTDRQSALLNRDPRAGSQGGAFEPGKPWRPASSLDDQAKGLSSATGAANASTDADFLLSQISQNWDLPVGALGADTAVITLHFRLKPDGMLAGEPEILNRSYDPAFAAAADAAKRAVFRAQPFRIPPGRYEQFRDNTIGFDPRAMYGANHG